MNSERASRIKNVILITEIGLSVILPIVIGIFLGSYLDRRFESKSYMWICIAVGFVGGIVSAVNLVKRFAPKQDKKSDETYDLMAEWREKADDKDQETK